MKEIKLEAKLPPKMYFGNFKVENIDKRKIGLNQYLKDLLSDEVVWV
jgi:hypothetical protein